MRILLSGDQLLTAMFDLILILSSDLLDLELYTSTTEVCLASLQ